MIEIWSHAKYGTLIFGNRHGHGHGSRHGHGHSHEEPLGVHFS